IRVSLSAGATAARRSLRENQTMPRTGALHLGAYARSPAGSAAPMPGATSVHLRAAVAAAVNPTDAGTRGVPQAHARDATIPAVGRVSTLPGVRVNQRRVYRTRAASVRRVPRLLKAWTRGHQRQNPQS